MCMAKTARARILGNIEQCERNGLLSAPEQERNVRACRRRVADGLLVEPLPGLFAPKSYWSELKPAVRPYQLLRSLAHKHPSWLFCSYSAACIHGLPASLKLLDCIHLATGKDSHSGAHGYIVRHKLDHPQTTRIAGASVTTLEQTVVDCLCQAPFPDGLAIADAAARMLNMSNAELDELLRTRGRCRRGIVKARETARYADARSESGGESIARALMISLGFAIPDLQVDIPDPTRPGKQFTVDYYWVLPDGRIIVGEFDGADKYTLFSTNVTESVLRSMMRERQRESRLTLACDGVVQFSYPDLMNPEAFARLLSSYGIPRR